MNWTSFQSHTSNGFFKLVKALLQIYSCFFSHSIKLRGLPLSAITSLAALPAKCKEVCIQARKQRGKRAIALVPKISKTCSVVRYNNRLQFFAPLSENSN